MTRSTTDNHAVRLLLFLYLADAFALLMLIGIYKAPRLDPVLLPTKAGITLIAGTCGLIFSGWLMAREVKPLGARGRKALALALASNALIGLVILAMLEMTVRFVSRKTDAGIVINKVLVEPTWPELVAQSRDVLAGTTQWGGRPTYFIFDPELGWTVGPNRRSGDGMYFSSFEGVRSPGPGMRLADRAPPFRVALIGDSNAFSLEVPFEESWGHHLQQLLGTDVQVVNFGVDGYGIDQVYLRYLRDVRPWKPQVVVLGFIAHDLSRTMAVYPFVSFGWPGYITKPRFALEEGEPRLLNVPLPAPDEILGAGQIHDLPFVDYDLGYASTDWSWRFDHSPLSYRFLTAAFPRWRIAEQSVSREATVALNSWLLAGLVKAIEQAGSAPLVVTLSDPGNALMQETLQRARLAALDGTACLTEIPPDRRLVASGHHFTGPANRSIARCTAPAVERTLRGRRTGLNDPGIKPATYATAMRSR